MGCQSFHRKQSSKVLRLCSMGVPRIPPVTFWKDSSMQLKAVERSYIKSFMLILKKSSREGDMPQEINAPPPSRRMTEGKGRRETSIYLGATSCARCLHCTVAFLILAQWGTYNYYPSFTNWETLVQRGKWLVQSHSQISVKSRLGWLSSLCHDFLEQKVVRTSLEHSEVIPSQRDKGSMQT
jgi:hypothetical protein